MNDRSDDSDPRYQALVELLRTADSLWNASRTFFEPWDLGPSQFNVLNLLHANPEGRSQTELGRQLIMHRSNITGLVDRLERRGLVERKDAAADRRAYRVVLSPAGNRLMQEILPQYYAGAIRIWEGITPKRATELVSLLRQVARNAERIARSNSAQRTAEGKPAT